MRSFFFGNALTGTNFKNGEFGAIYTECKYEDIVAQNGEEDYSDAGNNKTSEIDARGNETKYEYDSVTSKPTKVTDRCGNETSYTYDAAGKLVEVKVFFSGNLESSHAITYDENGNVLTVTDKNGVITRTYDALNRVTAYTDTYGNTIGYEYDAVKIRKLVDLIHNVVDYELAAERKKRLGLILCEGEKSGCISRCE